MSKTNSSEDNSHLEVQYAEAKTHRWGWKTYRVSWQEGTPKFTIGILKERMLYIELDEIHNLADAIDELAEKIEQLA